MSDNLAVTPGTGGATIATDQNSSDSVHYPISKVMFGALNTFNLVDDSSGKRLPVNLAESTLVGAVTETAPATDTASSGLNGRLQRLAQRLTSLIALIPAALTGSGNFKVSLNEVNATVAVTDNSGSLTVDGTVAATQSGTWNVGTVTTVTNVVHVDDNSGALTVDNAGTFAVQASVAAAATSIAKAEDVASANADVGVPAMAVRKATPANTSGNDGDYEMLQMANGRLWMNGLVAGDVASDGADSGNPVKIGGRARTSDITAVSHDDRVDLVADTLGKQVVLHGATHDLLTSGTHNYVDNAAADVIAAAGAGVKIAVTSVLVTNAHATVSTKINIRDATTAKITLYSRATGSPVHIHAGGIPLFVSAANAAVTAICATTGSDVDVSISGYKITN